VIYQGSKATYNGVSEFFLGVLLTIYVCLATRQRLLIIMVVLMAGLQAVWLTLDKMKKILLESNKPLGAAIPREPESVA
jgi:uncharacterized membrane protein